MLTKCDFQYSWRNLQRKHQKVTLPRPKPRPKRLPKVVRASSPLEIPEKGLRSSKKVAVYIYYTMVGMYLYQHFQTDTRVKEGKNIIPRNKSCTEKEHPRIERKSDLEKSVILFLFGGGGLGVFGFGFDLQPYLLFVLYTPSIVS